MSKESSSTRPASTATTISSQPPPEAASTIPDPDEDPTGYLLAKGWKPRGNPKSRRCEWFDPTKPAKEVTRKVKIGEKKLPNGTVEELFQTHIDPEAWPMSRDQAVALQMDRDEGKATT